MKQKTISILIPVFMAVISLMTLVPADASETIPELSIRLYNKQVYTVNSRVEFLIEIKNTTYTDVEFNLADNRIHNIKFDVRTEKNEVIPESDNSIRQFATGLPIYYTKALLKPGEKFSFVVALNDFVDLLKPDRYLVKAAFYLNFRSDRSKPIISNSMEVEVISYEDDFRKKAEEKNDAILGSQIAGAPQPMQPDSVVTHMLNSKMKGDWQNYFLYVDSESLLLNSLQDKSEYLKLSEARRISMVNDYKNMLVQGKKDKDLILTPSKFTVQKTSYTQETANVVVNEDFIYPSFVEKKQYIYYLKRHDNIWMVYDYNITNIAESKK